MNEMRFDLSIPQQYLDAIAANDAKITAQTKVWQTYIDELAKAQAHTSKLRTQMGLMSGVLSREMQAQARAKQERSSQS
jgi:phage-related tail protein